MFLFSPTVILRHKRENLKKCSLKELESRSDLYFFTYPCFSYPVTDYLLLDIDAPVLSEKDQKQGLLLLDGTWRLVEKMKKVLFPNHILRRSLPCNFQTAYPRRQNDCSDPKRGLASVEALYIAYVLMGRNPEGLLDHYHWKKEFLKKNEKEFSHYI